ncbi:hypothetical protein CLAFUW4_13318 [Fulvia fulva]|uniref:Uncharacterized protein n=1 Tax=Passalora fulva TaxID=5499 RepID=A0A9Q8PKD8_PASFU|nr:uncharacterized protein CLAFUR5_13172 [Fulvia fulva]KAK4612023.1 hypothetical protein CLAFUR4_13323 [Fulvia fulva]UJO24105.1 hypothetical protein CLAFUR5_13172 [Fulvia fulva]WPV20884.1 hypothetical protein CLAFUW4_13318 [Fulvia fulva]WPV36418.1 hypothetical protein CLAFUW7_13325 [Fulvia fulva]
MTSRIALPELGRGDDDIGSIMAGAPASNFNLLKKLLLLGSTNTIACRVTDTDDDTDHISRFLIRLHHTCPNISEFRIHLDIDYRVNVECFAAEQFRGILQWQKLKKVVVEVSKCQQGPGQLSCASDEQVVRLREKIVMVLQAEMMRRGMRSLLLVADRPVPIDPWAKSHPNRPQLQAAILGASHQTYSEATSILYGKNTIMAFEERELPPSLKTIGTSLQHIRRVDLHYISTKLHFKKLLTLLKGAERLEVPDMNQETLRFTPEELAEIPGPFMRALHKARGKIMDYDMKKMLDVLVIQAQLCWANETNRAEWHPLVWKSVVYERRFKQLIEATLK